MNFSLTSSNNNKKKIPNTNLGYGLNARGNTESTKPVRQGTSNVFGDSDDDDDDDDGDDGNQSNRDRVNRQIKQEQEAMRQRALATQEAVMAATATRDGSQPGNHIYDYDGAYDSFHPSSSADHSTQPSGNENNNNHTNKDNNDKSTKRKSRYIEDLLKASKKRGMERDAIYERRIAKEQAAEDALEEYAGKEKFVTKAYRRKLEERQQWQAEQEESERQEMANDVTKKSAGSALVSFYGNFSKNVAMGGACGGEKTTENINDDDGKKDEVDDNDYFNPNSSSGGGMDFLSGFERSDKAEGDDITKQEEEEMNRGVEHVDNVTEPTSDDKKDTMPMKQMSMRERREEKVRQARIRYLQRKGITSSSNSSVEQ